MEWEGFQICLTLDVSLIQRGYTPLYFASNNSHEELVVLLLDHKLTSIRYVGIYTVLYM